MVLLCLQVRNMYTHAMYMGGRANIHPATQDVLVVLIHVQQQVPVLALGQVQFRPSRCHSPSPWIVAPGGLVSGGLLLGSLEG